MIGLSQNSHTWWCGTVAKSSRLPQPPPTVSSPAAHRAPAAPACIACTRWPSAPAFVSRAQATQRSRRCPFDIATALARCPGTSSSLPILATPHSDRAVCGGEFEFLAPRWHCCQFVASPTDIWCPIACQLPVSTHSKHCLCILTSRCVLLSAPTCSLMKNGRHFSPTTPFLSAPTS